MLRYLFSSPPDITGFILVSVVFIIALSLHEYGHALSANLQGDPTAKLAGRLTINPRAHLDPVGTFMLVMVGFGWGKPVPFAPNKLRSQRFGAAMVAIAGPAVNVVLAFISAAALVALVRSGASAGGFTGLLGRFLEISLGLNVTLALFNMIPVPPLDGSRILGAILPADKQHIIYFLDKWGFVALLLIGFVIFPRFAGPIINSTARIILTLAGA